MVGPLPILGLKGHSAALTKALRSSCFKVHADCDSTNSGNGAVGENVAYN